MKKLTVLFFVFLFLTLPGSVLASTLSLSPSTGTFNQGCNFAVDVLVDTQGIQSDGTDAIVMYDTSRFSAETITNGTVYPDYPGNNIDAASGKITISGLASVSAPFTGKGILATINFKVMSQAAAGASQMTFDFDPIDKAKTTDSNVVQRETVVDTLNSVVNGSYIVGTGSCGSSGVVTPGVQPSQLPRTGGPYDTSTPSATIAPVPYVPQKTLPDGGTAELTATMAIVGTVLTILGVLGLALL